MATVSEVYPKPPSHYSSFASGPTALQPPDISSLGPTYRMFGQVVQNPLFGAENANTPPPAIDKDVSVYDAKKGLKSEIIRMIDSLPASIQALLSAIQNKPTEANGPLRDFDNRVKSLFHALEVLRPHEAKMNILRLSEEEVRTRTEANQRCEAVLEKVNTIIPS